MGQAMDRAGQHLERDRLAVCKLSKEWELTCAIIWQTICSSLTDDRLGRIVISTVHLGDFVVLLELD